MYVAVVQFNPTVGALKENCKRALGKIDELAALSYPPDLVVFPAFALTGAELGGLVTHNAFAAETLDVAQEFIKKAALPALIGTVLPRPTVTGNRFVCEEEVLFAVGGKGSALGFLDMNNSAEMQEYVENVKLTLGGLTVTVVLDDVLDTKSVYRDSDVIISMVARPFQDTNGLLTASNQIDSLRMDAIENDAWIIVANLCGGEDAFVYEGASIVLAPNGTVVESAPPFIESVFTLNLSGGRNSFEKRSDQERTLQSEAEQQAKPSVLLARKHDKKRIIPLLPYEATWQALCAGTRDYVCKNGFSEVVVGLSGGIDSAMIATLACDALGSQHVHGVIMPSPYSSQASLSDAKELAGELSVDTLVYPIDELMSHYFVQSEELLGSRGSILAQQNLQARLRTVILMHLSNTHNWLLLNTSNKSEAAVGYSTLYGDTAGALAPFGSVYKTDVYGLAHWRNSKKAIIPQAIIDKEPSAELAPKQKDVDTLPPYETLDQILRLHIEEDLGVDEILEFFSNYPIKTNVDADTILEVLDRVRAAEYKRRQEPLAFQFDSVDITMHRSWPITNGFKDHSRDIIEPTKMFNYLRRMYRESGPGGSAFLNN